MSVPGRSSSADGPAGPCEPATEAIRVLVVDEAEEPRRRLRAVVESVPGFAVVADTAGGTGAVDLVRRLRPAVVLMHLHLPGGATLGAIEEIMAGQPTPIVLHTTAVGSASGLDAVEALAAGAVDVLIRPRCDDGGSPAEFVQELRQRLRVASRVRVIRHPRGRLRGASADDDRVGVRRRAAGFGQVGQPGLFQVVVIGASTGGPAALATVLRGLPPGFPAAVVVVQHMSAAFVDGLAHWLNGTCALPVDVAVDGGQLLPATVLIAPGGGNLIVNSNLTTRCQPPAVGQFHVPGIDHTLTSLAGSRGERVVGVLLTGMGRDGAAGLLALRQRGAVTIGQDEATSAVYGMPAAALALGAVEYQLPLAEIAPVLCRLVLAAGSAGRPTAAAATVGSATVGSAAVGSAPVGSAPVVVPTNGSGTAR